MSQITTFEKLQQQIEFGDGRKLDFHHFNEDITSYAEVYCPAYSKDNPNRFIIGAHYHHDHDEYMYIIEGKLKICHQLWDGPGLLWGKKTKWVETMLDATTPTGIRQVKLERDLKHSLEQMPGYAIRVRERSNPESFFMNKEAFFRHLFMLPITPPFLLLCSLLGSNSDFYVGFDIISFVLGFIGRLAYPEPPASGKQLQYHYDKIAQLEMATQETHPWLYNSDGRRFVANAESTNATSTGPIHVKKRV